VPLDIPPDGLSQTALDNKSETAANHAQWPLSTAALDALSQSSNPPPLDHVPPQAEDHVPPDIPPDGLPQTALESLSGTAEAQLAGPVEWLISTDAIDALIQSSNATPLDHIPAQAEGHVPPDTPPDGLPQTALDNVSGAAEAQLAHHVEWLISTDAVDALSQSSNAPPLDHIPPQAEDYVPPDIPPDDLPQTALENMSGMAESQLTNHVEWLIT